MVVNTIVTAVEVKFPSCQFLVGSDAKTIMLVLRMFPKSIANWMVSKNMDLPEMTNVEGGRYHNKS